MTLFVNLAFTDICSYISFMATSHKFRSFTELLAFIEKAGKSDLFRYEKAEKLCPYPAQEWVALVRERKAEFEKRPSSAVALIENKTPELAADIFAAVMAGKRLLLIDPMESLEKMSLMLAFSESEEIVSDACLEKEELATLQKALKPASGNPATSEGDLLFFTSGTSGLSKGCVLTSASLLDSSYNGQERLPCGPNDIILSALPLSHVFGFVCTFLWPLCYGASVALGGGIKHVAQDVLFFKPTILPVIPALAGFLLSLKAINPELVTLLVGAGPLSLKFIQAFRSLGKKVAFGYGLTETSSGVAISVDSDNPFAMQPCPEDEFRQEDDGTISIRSAGLMKGYYKNPEATQAAIQDGWLRTNDRGYLDEAGNLHILGRKDDVVVLSNGTKYDCALGEEKLLGALGLPFDLALSVREGKLALLVYLPKEELKPLLTKTVADFNLESELYGKINQIVYEKAPLPRTKTGKIIRYQLMEKEE